MPRVTLEQAYPALQFRQRSRNWWARLAGTPAECVHLETPQTWMATLVPDTLYLRGKGVARRQPARPEVSLCRSCLLDVLEPELVAFSGRVLAFEPDAETFSQYFFIARGELDAAGLRAEVARAIEKRFEGAWGECSKCARRAIWLWLPRDQVGSLDEVQRILDAPGTALCSAHGAAALRQCFLRMTQANLFYINVPYGDSGAYLWI